MSLIASGILEDLDEWWKRLLVLLFSGLVLWLFRDHRWG